MKAIKRLLSIKNFGIKIFILSFLLRLVFVITMGNTKNPEMYEYGFLARNMLHGYGYTMYWPYEAFAGKQTEHPSSTVKSAFMPPFNPYFIYLNFKLFGDNSFTYLLLMLLYSFIGSFTPLLAYLIARMFSGELPSRLTGISALLFLPAAFSVVTFSGSTIYHFFILAIIYYSIKTVKIQSNKYYIITSILSGLLILNRSEFLILAFLNIFLIGYLGFKNTKFNINIIKRIIYGSLIITAIVAPWSIRNTIIFNKFIPVVSHPWHEIWRGNNRYSVGGELGINCVDLWATKRAYPEIVKKLDSIPYNQHHELACDSVFKSEVLTYFNNNKLHVVILSLKRMLILWTIDIYTPRARDIKYSFFNIITLIPLLIGFIKFYKYSKRTNNYEIFLILLLFLIYHTLAFGLTNVITRYQVYVFTMALPLTGLGWFYILRLFDKSKKIFDNPFSMDII